MKYVSIPLAALVAAVALQTVAEAQTAAPMRGYQYQFTTSDRPYVPQPGATSVPKGLSVGAPTTHGWRIRNNMSASVPATQPAPLAARPVQNPARTRLVSEVTQKVAQAPTPAPGTAAAPPTYAPVPAAPYTQGTPTPQTSGGGGGISSIYAYAGRGPGPYCYNGVQYYNYGGSCGWGSPYNSTYYNDGCYQANGCCRASRRIATPFGGAFRGCSPGCYVVTPPPCPTNCQPYETRLVIPGAAPQTSSPATAVPQPLPPEPLEPPAPPEPTVKPEPQASLGPQVPVFPRIPNLPET